MGARDKEGHHSPAQPRNACSRKSPVVEEDSLQVSFLELQGEVTQFVGRAEDAVIAMSSYRLHIRFKESVVNVPLMLIESVECRDALHLHITCKDCKAIRCRFSSVEQCQEWARRVTAATRPPSRLEDLFSFAFHTRCAGDPERQGDACRPGDHVTSRFRNEVERMGFDTQGVWRISEINSKYRLCPSYPQLLLVPGWVSDAQLENVAAFRSWKRFPTVVYRHQSSGAVIARCAQPEVSWWGWRNSDDERLVQSITKACAAGGRDCKYIANGSAVRQHSYRRMWHEPASRSLPQECTNWSVSHEQGNRMPGDVRESHEHANGSVSHEHSYGTHGNGSVSHEHANWSTSHERTSGSISQDGTNGSVSHENSNGSISHEHTNRSVSQAYYNGTVTNRAFIHEHANGGLLSHREFDVSVSRGVQGDRADALPQKLLILDARSYAAAVANRAKGGGCEYPEYYPSCEVVFMGMANIHSIRKSFQALRSLCTQTPDPANWLSGLEATRWLQHLALLFKAALLVVMAVDRDRRPVLVHCSDGWDRTPQIVALSKLLLDPYYRTIEGFQVLVETEWLDFGHKFGDRCGHGEKAEDLNERCPVFLQWLDCVHQLHRQFPCSFQFNESFLVKLVQHTYSCLFGTFLCNSGRERAEGHVQERTCSLWSLMRPTNPTFQNILYSAHSETVLRPVCHVRSLMLWGAVYLPSSLPTSPSDDSCAPCPTPFPGASPEEEPLGRHAKMRSFENLPGEAGGSAPPNRRSGDPALKDKRPSCHTPSRDLGHGAGPDGGGAADLQGAGGRVRRSSGRREDEPMAGEGSKEEEELKAAAGEDTVAGPPAEERAEEAQLSVAVGVAEDKMEHFLQEATEDDPECTAELECPPELSLAPPSPSPTAPPSPPPPAPPTYLPLEGCDGPEVCEQQERGIEQAPETPGAPSRPEQPTSPSARAARTSPCADAKIAIETHAEIAIETRPEEGGAGPNAVAHTASCRSPPCLNTTPPCEAEPQGGRGLQRTPGCVGRRSSSTPPRVPTPPPVCNGERSPLWQREPAGGGGCLAPPSDALQLRQVEAGHRLEGHALKCQVQELWSRLESRDGNGQPGAPQTCSPDSDCSAESPCWEQLEQHDTEVPQWYPDHLDRNCYRCEGRLWMANRKDRCRPCGNMFCANCCEQRVVVSSRACEACRSALPPVDLELEKPITASSS